MEPIQSLPDFYSVRNVDAPGSFAYLQAGRTRQVRPYNKPTAYYTYTSNCERATKGSAMFDYLGWANAASAKAFPALCPGCESSFPESAYAVNAARAKFLDELSNSVETAVNYAERKQSLGMISRRASQLGRIADFVRNGEFSRVQHELDLRNRYSSSWRKRSNKWVKTWTLRRRRNPRRYAKSGAAADAFLEISFGWKPLLNDIVTATTLLWNTPSGDFRVNGRRFVATYSSLQVGGTTKVDTTITFRASMGATVSVSNPNLWLANQLGLLNIPGIAWELVRFSFLLDYVVNVGEWLGQWTDFSGLSLVDPWYSVTSSDGVCKVKYFYSPGNELETVSTYSHHRRHLGIPGVTLSVAPYNPLNAFRAGISISLLIQKLRNLQP
ncbi:TPA_asm: maturation protein [ssRNA phage SRR7976301_8]|uniref:Maturation protein n=1 Tax=ssRNA phage SRR7976301_8 TaxID=2786669 RepID=A0A8S5KZH5_9VIRU|nr:maturation protein [ssRNA phage SRR7976301_8]DAD51118.1 TPA_asm: maturation protein [ssRNA phage SRR7976301_8]